MKAFAMVAALAIAVPATAQQKPPELTGTVSFEVSSDSARVERIVVQIGDGGRGPYKAILAGDSSLPTHTIYRPRDLSPFGPSRKLPIVVFGSGGCRNGSGEFRNFLSDIASFGYLVVAIGPAGDSVVGGGEGSLGMTAAIQLLDGLDWATRENARAGGEYYQKLEFSKVAAMGQSCGTWQAMDVSGDPRITTTVLLNGGGAPPSLRPALTPAPAAGGEPGTGYGRAGASTTDLSASLDRMARRYAPYAPKTPLNLSSLTNRKPVTFRAPVLYMPGGPSDLAYQGARAAFEAETSVPAVFASQDVGHYPATYRQPHGGGPKLAPFYRDVAVLAFKRDAADVPMMALTPAFSVSGKPLDAGLLVDGDLNKTLAIPAAPPGQSTSLDIDLGTPRTIYALSLGLSNAGNLMAQFMATTGDGAELQASDDGHQYRSVVRMPRGRLPQYTASFPGVRARYFRLVFSTPQAAEPGLEIAIPGLALPKGPAPIQLTEVALHSAPRVHRFEDKAGFAPTAGLDRQPTPDMAPAATATTDVLDLTGKMRPDGTLDWTPPPGPWTVLRIGCSLTGKTNSPATAEATGLEVDKLSASAVKDYFTMYLDMYREATGGLMGKRGVSFMITDSWEAGTQNWTDDMAAEFARRRGYDLRPWLPALTGHIVGSAAATDKFLWDYRATIAELTIANHYDQLTTILRERGMGRYSESHEDRRAMIADGMEVKRTADVPMSAMWTGRGGPLGVPPQFAADIRESASVAHIYGQNLVAAESLTAAGGAYGFSPETLKATADAELSQGVNRFVIHTSVHQPLEKGPGLGLGPVGQWFTRHETWAEQAVAWTTYLARSSYLLQQGRFVADILYHYGDDTNLTALFGEKAPDIPAGYNWDYANSDVILHRLTASPGRLATATGMRYRVLVLDASARLMPLPVLRKIRDLVKAGAVIVGPKPSGSPRLLDDGAEFKAIAEELWGTTKGMRAFGAGKVYADGTVAEALAGEKVLPDFEHTKPQADSALLFVHRSLPDGEIYWVNNRQKRAESLEATFRVTGKAPEIWHPETGRIEPAGFRVENGCTVVPLRLEVEDAVFVVFRAPTARSARIVPPVSATPLTTVEGPWTVTFQAGRGAPATATFATLTPWNEHADRGIKYFSGSATYTKSIDAAAVWLKKDSRIWLDLGDVKNLAEVTVNGRKLGTVWKTPFRVEVTGALRPGANTLEITVTNLWVNQIIGDLQPGVAEKITHTTWAFYKATSGLLPSGLLGPVRLVEVSGGR